jgi:hypothetical protein
MARFGRFKISAVKTSLGWLLSQHSGNYFCPCLFGRLRGISLARFLRSWRENRRCSIRLTNACAMLWIASLKRACIDWCGHLLGGRLFRSWPETGFEDVGRLVPGSRVGGSSPFHRIGTDKHACSERPIGHEKLTYRYQSGAIKPIVAKTFQLAEAAEALRYLVEDRPFGRVVPAI